MWRRWKQFAHRAAEVQSHVLLAVLYYIALVPLAFVRRPFSNLLSSSGPPHWLPHQPQAQDLSSSRRQY